MVNEQNASYNNGNTGHYHHHHHQQQHYSHGKSNGNVLIHYYHSASSKTNHDEPQSTLVQIEADDNALLQLSIDKMLRSPSSHGKQPIKGILKNGKMASSTMVSMPTVVEVAPTPTDTTNESSPNTSRPSSVRQPKMGILKNQFYSNHVFNETQDDPNEIVELHDDESIQSSSLVPKTFQPQQVTLDMSAVTNNDRAKPLTTTNTNQKTTNNTINALKSDKVVS